MSIVKGSVATKVASGGLSNQAAAGVQDARVKLMIDTYEADSTADGTTIVMGRTLPEGARLQEIILAYDALASGVYVTVGDSASASRYISYQSATAAAVKRITAIDGLDYAVGTAANDGIIIVTTSGAAATGTIKLAVLYTRD